jgi:hypothetical protein
VLVPAILKFCHPSISPTEGREPDGDGVGRLRDDVGRHKAPEATKHDPTQRPIS